MSILKLQHYLTIICMLTSGLTPLFIEEARASGPSQQTIDSLLKALGPPKDATAPKVIAPPLKTDETSLHYNFSNRLSPHEKEAFNLLLPSGWVVGFTQSIGNNNKQGTVYEFVNNATGQTMKNWSESLSIVILKATPDDEDAIFAKNLFLNGAGKRAPNIGWNAARTLRESPQDSLAIWEEHSGRGDKEIIARFLKNKTDTYSIMYQSKVPFLNDPVKKQQWLDWLETATLKVLKDEALLKN